MIIIKCFVDLLGESKYLMNVMLSGFNPGYISCETAFWQLAPTLLSYEDDFTFNKFTRKNLHSQIFYVCMYETTLGQLRNINRMVEWEGEFSKWSLVSYLE